MDWLLRGSVVGMEVLKGTIACSHPYIERKTTMALRSLPLATRTSTSNECGACTECCQAFPLLENAELWPNGKRAFVSCPYLDGRGCGCGIYSIRPAVCRD